MPDGNMWFRKMASKTLRFEDYCKKEIYASCLGFTLKTATSLSHQPLAVRLLKAMKINL